MSLEFGTFTLKDWETFIAIIAAVAGLIFYAWPHVLRFFVKTVNEYQLAEFSQKLDKNKGRVSRKDLYQWITGVQKIHKQSEKYDLKEQVEKATQIETRMKYLLRYHIRVYPIAFFDNSDFRGRIASMILKQNSIQSLFQFELGYFKNDHSIEDEINSVSAREGGPFIEACEEIIANREDKDHGGDDDVTRVIITRNELPKNYYLRSHTTDDADWYNPQRKNWGRYKPGRFYMLSIAYLDDNPPESLVSQFLLRQIQRICIRIIFPQTTGDGKKRMTHNETRGCLFDFSQRLGEPWYFTDNAFICEDCISEILEAEEIPAGYRKEFLDEFQKWLTDTLPGKEKNGLKV